MKLTSEARRNLASSIVARQREAGMSFAEIGEATAIHPGQVSRICRGQFKTASASVMQICTFLGIPMDGLSSQHQEGDDYRRRLEQGIVAIWDGTSADANRILKLLRLVAEFRGSLSQQREG